MYTERSFPPGAGVFVFSLVYDLDFVFDLVLVFVLVLGFSGFLRVLYGLILLLSFGLDFLLYHSILLDFCQYIFRFFSTICK